MRRFVTRLVGLGLAAATPAAAGQPADGQSSGAPSKHEVAALMQSIFKVEPLTAEQEARLPQAERLIARIMPPGTMAKVMGGMFDKMLGPMMALASEASSSDVAEELSVEPEDIELEDAGAARVAAILDPVWKERRDAEMAAMQRMMSSIMTAMEPGMRKGMAEAYAIAFTPAELTDIDRFFATPSGASFAQKSYALASDPRLIAASMEALPQMMAQMKAMAEEAKAATAKFPPRRNYADLTNSERAEIARLTGLGQEAIRDGMARAAAKRAVSEHMDPQD